MTTKAPPGSVNSQTNDRFARVVRQKRAPNILLIGVLGAAILLGLLGFALHILWVVAIIVMALGFGFAVADGRRDRFDAEELADEQSTTSEPAPPASPRD